MLPIDRYASRISNRNESLCARPNISGHAGWSGARAGVGVDATASPASEASCVADEVSTGTQCEQHEQHEQRGERHKLAAAKREFHQPPPSPRVTARAGGDSTRAYQCVHRVVTWWSRRVAVASPSTVHNGRRLRCRTGGPLTLARGLSNSGRTESRAGSARFGSLWQQGRSRAAMQHGGGLGPRAHTLILRGREEDGRRSSRAENHWRDTPVRAAARGCYRSCPPTAPLTRDRRSALARPDPLRLAPAGSPASAR